MNTRLLSIMRKEFIQIARDARMLVIALLIPVVQLFMSVYAATNDVRNLLMAVLTRTVVQPPGISWMLSVLRTTS